MYKARMLFLLALDTKPSLITPGKVKPCINKDTYILPTFSILINYPIGGTPKEGDQMVVSSNKESLHRLLIALDYPRAAEFSIEGTYRQTCQLCQGFPCCLSLGIIWMELITSTHVGAEEVSKVVSWVEDRKIRLYDIETRAPLRTPSPQWDAAFQQVRTCVCVVYSSLCVCDADSVEHTHHMCTWLRLGGGFHHFAPSHNPTVCSIWKIWRVPIRHGHRLARHQHRRRLRSCGGYSQRLWHASMKMQVGWQSIIILYWWMEKRTLDWVSYCVCL